MTRQGQENTMTTMEILSAAVRLTVFLAVFVLTSLPAWAAETPCPGIHVKILDIKNNIGTVDCALFDSPEGYPRDVLRSASHVIVLKIRETQATCDFEGVPPGSYALAVIHDQNMNGKLDTNILGIPTEGYGFSNDVKAFFRAPSFSAANFQYAGGSLDLTISLHY